MAAQKPPAAAVSAAPAAVVEPQRFDSPGEAADALIDRFDVAAIRIMGGGQETVVLTGEKAQDREHAEAFAVQARERKEISVSPAHRAMYSMKRWESLHWPIRIRPSTSTQPLR